MWQNTSRLHRSLSSTTVITLALVSERKIKSHDPDHKVELNPLVKLRLKLKTERTYKIKYKISELNCTAQIFVLHSDMLHPTIASFKGAPVLVGMLIDNVFV